MPIWFPKTAIACQRKGDATMKLFSGANDEMDVKAVLSVVAFAVAIVIYAAYAIKGLIVHWDMPAAIRDVTIGLILGGTVGAGATLLNQRLGVTTTATATATVTVKEAEPAPGPVG
jgi:hypothetical protein